MPQSVVIPFYLDWTFWAVIIAACAMILSQLPPVLTWFKRARIEIELYSRIHITHKVGNPNTQLHIIINNIGGKTVRIKGASISLKRDGKELVIMSGQNYLQTPSDKTTVLFTPFYLKTKEEWAHLVNFLEFFSRPDEKFYRNAESQLKDNIQGKRELPENKNKLIEADPQFVTPLIEMFQSKFIWQPGEYEARISIDTVPNEASIQKSYRFTLFESDSNELSKFKDAFKYGDGIYWNSDQYPGIIVQIVEA